MKLDLLEKEIPEIYTRESFVRIKRDLEAQQILSGFWKFYELDLTQTGFKIPIKHNLSFIPRDIIILSKEGDQNLYFNYESFDSINFYITTPNPCRVRFLAGAYKEGGGKKDFPFISPPSAGLPSWFSGAANPVGGLGAAGDFYLNTSSGEVFLKTGASVWTSEGFLATFPPSLSGQLLEISAITLVANIWTPVPTTTINKIADVTIFDDLNKEEINIDWRLVGSGTAVEIRSKKANTYTVHIEGYVT